MNFPRLALVELRRLTSSRLTRIALAALVLIPTLYGGLYLFANSDPYARFGEMPAAIVTLDTGATLATGERVDMGSSIADDIVASGSFAWRKVSKEDAMKGVEEGTYAFALMFPPDFSAALTSPTTSNPRQAHLLLETNDANSYMASVIGQQMVKQVAHSVGTKVSQTAAQRMLNGFVDIHASLGKAVGGAQQVSAGADALSAGTTSLESGMTKLDAGLSQLETGATSLEAGVSHARVGSEKLHTGAQNLASGLGEMNSQTQALPAKTQQLAQGAKKVANANQQIASVGQEAAAASASLRQNLGAQQSAFLAQLRADRVPAEDIARIQTHFNHVNTLVGQADSKVQGSAVKLSTLADGTQQVADGSQALAEGMVPLAAGVNRAASGATSLASGASQLNGGLQRLDSGASSLRAGVQQAHAGSTSALAGTRSLQAGSAKVAQGATSLHEELAKGVDRIPHPSAAEREAVARTIGNPIQVDNPTMARASSYGAGLAPMFMALALWIGAYTLFLIVRPLSNRALATNQPSVWVALAGWLAPALVSVLQVTALVAVVTWGLRINVAHPILAFGFLILISTTFVAILHGLSARFGAVGKFLGLVFMVIQLVSAGGTFPWQTLPPVLQAIHAVVPMSYAIDGLRILMYGGPLTQMPSAIGVLVLYLVAGLGLATAAAHRHQVWTPMRLKPDLIL